MIEKDLTAMTAVGLNVVRTYTIPPPDLLDLAEASGLRMLVGLHYADWRMESSVGLRVQRRVLDAGRRALAGAMESLHGRPGVLALSVGNEVPADVVRLHGAGAVEETLSRLVEEVHRADPEMLATYCNFPTTEYLQVNGQDFASFNVFLERPDTLRAYLRRLHTVAGELPLVLTEVGLSAGVHGEEAQAASLEWQLDAADEAGCAGATVFSWTDEWAVAGAPMDGWAFGLSTTERSPKPALFAVRRWAHSDISSLRPHWPAISMVVCARNEERNIAACLGSLCETGYPNLEVIVCDDGSTDRTLEIAGGFPCRRLALSYGGLSRARNAGMEAATGEIVAYIDADARCHPDWPYHLALEFEDPQVGAAGGPNLPVPEAGFVERAVSMSPGGPVQVLLSDDRAEHIPGCNLAVRKDALEAVGGFEVAYRAAGDDVDICWKLSDAGYQIAYSAAAQVLHHRRASVRAYLRQQATYGRSERMVAGAHPHRFNRLGQARWSGFMYGYPRLLPALLRPIVYQGNFGAAPYQGVVRRPAEKVFALSLALVPLSLPLGLVGLVLALFNAAWLGLTAIVLLVLVGLAATVAVSVQPSHWERAPLRLRLLIGMLHIVQPMARTWGRLRGRPAARQPPRSQLWSGDRLTWLAALERELSSRHCVVRRGRAHDDWDFEVWLGPLISSRLRTAVLWNSQPLLGSRFRVRPALLAGSIASLLLVALTGLPGLVCAAALLLTAETELILLRHRIAVVRPRHHPRGRRLRTTRRLARELRGYKGRLLLLLCLNLLAMPLVLLTPLPLKIAVDSVVGRHDLPGPLAALAPTWFAGHPVYVLGFAAVLQVAVVAIAQLQEVATEQASIRLGERMTLNFRARMFRHIQRLSLAFHDIRGTADSVYRIQYDAPSLQHIVVDAGMPLITSFAALVSMGIVIALLDWRLALVALAVSPLLFLLSAYYQRRMRGSYRAVKKLESASLGVVSEVLSAMRVVKAFGREEREQDRFKLQSLETLRARVGLTFAESIFGVAVNIAAAAGTALVLFVGILSVRSGRLTLGELLLVLAYLTQLYRPLTTISKKVADVQSSFAGLERAFEVLDEVPEVLEVPAARHIRRALGELEFEHVSFGYQDRQPVLRDISIRLEPGTRLGIAGRTGVGKTTLISLLMRFYDPRGGRILLDGVDLRDYRLEDLRAQFAIVLQDPVLFSAPVSVNIAYGRPGADPEQIKAAARAANAHDFITALPDGYSTTVGERGLLLSVGERQRIALARAFLMDAPILILDEPTSSVDVATEAQIMQSMERLMAGRTTLMIAHRLATLESCDLKIELSDGVIAGNGAMTEAPRRPLAIVASK
jgi:ATP-binding cassette subfamily B protein